MFIVLFLMSMHCCIVATVHLQTLMTFYNTLQHSTTFFIPLYINNNAFCPLSEFDVRRFYSNLQEGKLYKLILLEKQKNKTGSRKLRRKLSKIK